jgi:hypothetical protein
MTHETVTSLASADVLARAKRFFQDRVPGNAAFPEREGPAFLSLRGQGGEEIVFSVMEVNGQTRVRAGTLFFDQAVDRFFSTLPPVAEVAV